MQVFLAEVDIHARSQQDVIKPQSSSCCGSEKDWYSRSACLLRCVRYSSCYRRDYSSSV